MSPRAAILACLLTLAVPAAAAADWTAPHRLSEPISSVGGPGAGFDTRGPLFDVDGRGRAFTLWAFHSGRGSAGFLDGMKANSRGPGQAWSPERTLAVSTSNVFGGGEIGLPGPVTDYGVYDVSRLMLASIPAGPLQTPDRVAVGLGSTAGRFTSVVRIGPRGRRVGAARLAVDAAGRAVVAWPHTPLDGRRARIVAVRRTARGAWTDSVPLSARGASDVAVARSGRTVVVAWARGDRVEARVSTSRGRSWGAVRRLGRTGVPGPRLTQVAASVGAGGRAVVAWFARPAISEDSTGRTAVYRAAYRQGDGGFGAAIALDSYQIGPIDFDLGSGGLPQHLETAFDTTDDALIAWQDGGPAAGDWAVKVAAVGSAGAAPAQVVSGPGPVRFGDLATGAGDRAAVSFSRIAQPEGFGAAVAAEVAVRPHGEAAFAAPEVVHQPSWPATHDLGVRLAFDLDGSLSGVWSESLASGGGALYTSDRR